MASSDRAHVGMSEHVGVRIRPVDGAHNGDGDLINSNTVTRVIGDRCGPACAVLDAGCMPTVWLFGQARGAATNV
jgi:hypothetical protein